MALKLESPVCVALPEYHDSWSSDELESRTSTTDVSTPPSSFHSPVQEEYHFQFPVGTVRLPTPFAPPSLVGEVAVGNQQATIPRPFPSKLNLPRVPEEKACKAIDPADVGTPDAWIPRDSRLVRLTGKHPFNCEAKLRDLFAQGFLTPSNLFYVRNHGAVPKIDHSMAETWTLKIHGQCSNPTTFTLKDLQERFKVATIPVTLVCAGNRRKEQNMVKKSLGFSWGAAGISTALFTGVYLADVLDCIAPMRKAKHVIFEGVDHYLPNGPYGTSQLLSWARDKRQGMLLAWAMNGLPLEPDHGYPLRLVVPGQIGGRSVKWLARIELSEHESQHHLHFHDNKVLPMPVSANQARAEEHWWYDPKYIIRDLNVNSAIACPDHDEILDISSLAPEETYTVKGYAYAGGGRRVTRVEISSDDGSTWSLAQITYPEDTFRNVALFDTVYGDVDLTDSDTCFCWCFWSFEMPIATMKESRAIIVRCMDESLALQPRDMYWSPTGMMNNWWFRVCIHHLEGGRIRFEHPTMAGNQLGGWMQRLKDAGLDPSRPNFSITASVSNQGPDANVYKNQEQEAQMTKPGINRRITPAELESPEAKEDAWFVVQGEVYRGRGFFNDHPGGASAITLVAGQDATEDFMAIHSSDAKKQLADFHIGTLDGAIQTEEGETSTGSFLETKKWKKLVLVNIRNVSKDAKIYRFSLENNDQELGLPFGQHVYVRLRRKIAGKDGKTAAEGELVQRAYTPLSGRDTKGFVDMLVKIYYPTPTFPQGGRMTLGFNELMPGDTVEMKGPIGHFVWKGKGLASVDDKEKRVAEVGLVCGGSGITPILQVLRAILGDPTDRDTKIWAVDVNRDFEDILCREELDRLAIEHKGRFQIHYSLTGKGLPDNWAHTGSIGRVTREMLEAHLPAPADGNMVCICGPGPMEKSVKNFLGELGWNVSNQVVIF